jgi:hypothetical protein
VLNIGVEKEWPPIMTIGHVFHGGLLFHSLGSERGVSVVVSVVVEGGRVA